MYYQKWQGRYGKQLNKTYGDKNVITSNKTRIDAFNANQMQAEEVIGVLEDRLDKILLFLP